MEHKKTKFADILRGGKLIAHGIEIVDLGVILHIPYGTLEVCSVAFL